MVQVVLLVIIEWVRARTNQAHVSLEDIPELRQLVKTIFPQEPPRSRNPGIIFNLEERPFALVAVPQRFLKIVRIAHHGSELVARKHTSFFSDSSRAVEHHSRRV